MFLWDMENMKPLQELIPSNLSQKIDQIYHFNKKMNMLFGNLKLKTI